MHLPPAHVLPGSGEDGRRASRSTQARHGEGPEGQSVVPSQSECFFQLFDENFAYMLQSKEGRYRMKKVAQFIRNKFSALLEPV